MISYIPASSSEGNNKSSYHKEVLIQNYKILDFLEATMMMNVMIVVMISVIKLILFQISSSLSSSLLFTHQKLTYYQATNKKKSN